MYVFRGDTPIFELEVTKNRQPFDLTGYTIRFTAESRQKTIQKEIGSGITVTDEAGGIATIQLNTADTAEVDVFDYDVEIRKDSDVFTIAKDVLEIRDDISK